MRAAQPRIAARFAKLAAEGRAGFIPFITAGDPTEAISAEILAGLPAAGADVIELGMPFSDPMADGPAIQAAGQRALKAGANMRATLAMVRAFRAQDSETPIVLMGYYNPIHAYGVAQFTADAADAGADGLIVVDLPPEEDAELRVPAAREGLQTIRLAAPTSDADRLPTLLADSAGFVYYVSITGTTGTKAVDAAAVEGAVAKIKRATDLPVAVGFGIKTADHAAAIARIADATVVGSAIVERIAGGLDKEGRARPGLAGEVLDFVAALAAGVHDARAGARAGGDQR